MTRKPPGADSPGPEWRPPDGGTVEHTRPDPRAFTDTSSTSASHCVHWDNVSVDEYTAKNVCSMRHCSWIRGRTSTKETGPGRQACFSLGRVLKCCRHGRTDTLTIDHRQPSFHNVSSVLPHPQSLECFLCLECLSLLQRLENSYTYFRAPSL